MKRIPFQPTAQQIAILAGLLGVGALITTPAIAQPTTPAQGDPAMSPGETEPSPSNQPPNQPDPSSMTLVEVASGNESFETLVQAIQAADITDTLANQGPYTVFAPTDEAFAQLPDGALDYLLRPENRTLLQQVLAYHVVRGEVMSADLRTGKVETLNGGLAVRVESDRVIVNNASVVQADIQASNGVIHAVNRVLLSEALQDRLSRALEAQDLDP